MARETQGIAPGWYKDPADPTTQRWWDGEGWIGAPLPVDADPPPGPPPATAPERPAQAVTGRRGTPPVPPSPGPPPVEAIPPHHTPPGPPDQLPGPPAQPQTRPGQPPGQRPARQPPPRPHGYPLASLGARLVARLIDIGLLFLLNVLVNGWFVYQYVIELRPVVAEAWRRSLAGEPLSDLPDGGDAQTLLIVILFIAAALWFAYEVPAVADSGQTPGKRLLGIKVVRLEGRQPLGFARSFRRWNTMGLPTLLWWCGIGFLLQLVDLAYGLFDRPLQQTLHDKSAHTAVVAVAPSKLASKSPAQPQAEPAAKPPAQQQAEPPAQQQAKPDSATKEDSDGPADPS